jgi:hypothetical protein
MRIKAHTFEIPIFEGAVTCLIGGDVVSVNRYLKERHGDDFRAMSWDKETKIDSYNCYQFHIDAPMNDEVFYLWYPESIPSDIVHETNHLCSEVFFVRGIKYGRKSEECFRYFEGWMFGQIHSILKGKLKIKNKSNG